MNMKMRKILVEGWRSTGVGMWLLVLACLSVGADVMAQDADHNFKVAKNLEVFNTIYKNLDMMYVDTLDADEVVGNGVKAMLRSLDPYTEYYPEDKNKDVKMMLQGKYAGIGALIRYNFKLGRVCIDEPYENLPAAEVGLKKGDIILSIDGEDMTKRDNAYVSDHLRGEPGTTFELKIHRPSTGKDMKFKVKRRAIQLPAVPYYGMQPNGIGYLNLNSFTEGCGKAVRNAVIEMKKQGMKGLVFDLRNNGGGSEMEAVDIVNCFVPKGKLVVSNRGKMKQVNRDYKTRVEPVDTLMPVVVLVNGNSASASEITSGALQDFDRAVVMGTKTYGKGLVQTMIDLPYNGQMKLTTNKYYIPSGRCIQKLNYKHANGGSTEETADSLIQTFYTASGRPVKDGGGIEPDVEVKADSLPNIAYYLAGMRDSAEVLHSYEIDYIAKHPTIAPAAEFELTDADYEDFKQRVLASDFKYDALSEKSLDALEKVAKFEGYYDDAKPEFEALRKKLKHNLAKDLEYNKEAIKQILTNDIVTAYYYQRGAIQNTLRTDKQLKEAFRLLQNPEKYHATLRPATQP
ncbi:peptidase, S41 family [Hallella bergensis DSM 17361]|uniref:Peptidase, S41 family n=2 Tax=Hallella bergensis TaxID=242750 RepID=D1Q035_9BACT|nr:peptidase, S41 family [Hallella bergensis DSM 17361]